MNDLSDFGTIEDIEQLLVPRGSQRLASSSMLASTPPKARLYIRPISAPYPLHILCTSALYPPSVRSLCAPPAVALLCSSPCPQQPGAGTACIPNPASKTLNSLTPPRAAL